MTQNIPIILCLIGIALSSSFTEGFKLQSKISPFLANRQAKLLRETLLDNPISNDSPRKQLNTEDMLFSDLQGKALKPKHYPTLSELKANLPPDTFKRSTLTSLAFAAQDVALTAACAFLSYKFLLPIVTKLLAAPSMINKLAAAAIWTMYSLITGTVAIGMWVTAHECGHGAFSDNRKLQDLVGFVFHSLLLVPYYSWQRSHAVHHANTNHITDGETHVPPIKVRAFSSKKLTQRVFGKRLGEILFGFVQLSVHLLFGWPAYLLFGATGGPSRGITNHFIPIQFRRPFQNTDKLKSLYPGASWKNKVFMSDIGVVGAAAGLFALGKKFGFAAVAAAYGGPYLVVNAWLVAYTWLQHTEVDIPHLPAKDYSFMKGAFHTVDRPYEKMLGSGLIDYLHHHIGSTHVVHHIDSTIPHYRAKAATELVKQKYPDQYLYESTPIFKAIWRLATKCFIVEQRKNELDEDIYVFVDK